MKLQEPLGILLTFITRLNMWRRKFWNPKQQLDNIGGTLNFSVLSWTFY